MTYTVGIRAGDLGPRSQKERILNQLFPLSGWHSETFQDTGDIHPTKLGEEKYAWHLGEPPQRVSKDPDTVQWSYPLHHCPCPTQLSYTHNHCSYSNSRATGAWESHTPGVCRWKIPGNGDSPRAAASDKHMSHTRSPHAFTYEQSGLEGHMIGTATLGVFQQAISSPRCPKDKVC